MFWEDRFQADAREAEAFYTYFAELFLGPIPVNGCEYISRLRETTCSMFDLGSSPEGALVDSFVSVAEETGYANAQMARAVDRTRLCRGVDPTGILPPYEGNYASSGALGPGAIPEARAAYERAGVRFNSAERADFIGLQLAFAAYLARVEHERPERAAYARSEREGFVEQHLEWVPSYLGKAIEAVETDFFRGTLSVFKNVLEA